MAAQRQEQTQNGRYHKQLDFRLIQTTERKELSLSLLFLSRDVKRQTVSGCRRGEGGESKSLLSVEGIKMLWQSFYFFNAVSLDLEGDRGLKKVFLIYVTQRVKQSHSQNVFVLRELSRPHGEPLSLSKILAGRTRHPQAVARVAKHKLATLLIFCEHFHRLSLPRLHAHTCLYFFDYETLYGFIISRDQLSQVVKKKPFC